MAYTLDADVFISAKNFHYGFDFCPAFWDWLVQANEQKRVFSIERVGGELKAGDDRLAEWASQRGDGFFLKPTTEMLPALAAVSNWVVTNGYEPAAVDAFLQLPTTIWSPMRSRMDTVSSPMRSAPRPRGGSSYRMSARGSMSSVARRSKC